MYYQTRIFNCLWQLQRVNYSTILHSKEVRGARAADGSYWIGCSGRPGVIHRWDAATGETTPLSWRVSQGKHRKLINPMRELGHGSIVHNATIQVGQTDPLNMHAGQMVALGNVFPEGMETVEALAEYLTLAEYASDLGAGGALDLVVIPEPSTALLLLVGLSMLCCRVRTHPWQQN